MNFCILAHAVETRLIRDKVQLQRIEESATENIEFNQLRAHFETYVRTQAPPSSTQDKTGASTSAAQTAAAAAAARSSRLLRDVPSLANDPRFMPSYSGRSKSTRRTVAKQATEEFRPYEALTSPDHGRDARRFAGSQQDLDDGKALGIVGRKEQNRLEFARKQTDETMLSSLAQRWDSLWDESLKVRCVECRS